MYTLWDQITCFQNLYIAYRQAAKTRHNSAAVAGFEFDLESNLLMLQQELRERTYKPGAYTSFFIHDPKRRLISAAPFRDRVVHHALVNLIEPIFERKFIYDSYANRRGKGTHRALDRCTQFLRRYDYVLPIDIVQYFPSIDHDLLFDRLKNDIYEPEVLNLCRLIIDSGCGIHSHVEKASPISTINYQVCQRDHGLPIGNLTSQFWANVYLDPLDQYIKRTLRCRAYIRYVDDMLIFSNSKQELRLWLEEIRRNLDDLNLTIHLKRAQSRPTASGIPFLGFIVYPDYRRLKRRKVVIAKRRVRNMMAQYRNGEISTGKVREKTIAWLNHAATGDTWKLREKILKEITL